MAASQRWRLIGAASQLLQGNGVRVSARAIARSAGVSSSTLYEHFRDRDSIFVAACDLAFGSAIDAIAIGCDEEGDPGMKLGSALRAFLEWIALDPSQSALFHLEIAVETPEVALARAELARRIAEATEIVEVIRLAPLESVGREALSMAALVMLAAPHRAAQRCEELAALLTQVH